MATNLPEIVTTAELAALLADPPFSDRWLRSLADAGYLVKAGRGLYHLKSSVLGYVRYVRETELKGAEADASTSREMFEAERARKLKLENDQNEALLIETPDALAALDFIIGEVRTALAGVSVRATEDVAERRRIDDVIDETLAGITARLEQASTAVREGRDPLEADAPH